MTAREFDVIVIGAGAVGENVADRAAQGGLAVALVEAELVGGECSYWACMPSKALLRAGSGLRDAQRVQGAGAGAARVDPSEVFARRDRIVHDWDDSSQVEWVEGAGIHLVRGHARFSGEKRLTVTASDGAVTELVARHAVAVCTGSAALLPDIPGLADADPWTSRQGTSATAAPASLAVLGGGVVGCELATAYAGFGTTVTVLARSGLLGGMEPFAAELVARGLAELGVDVRTGAEVERVERAEDGARLHLSDGSTLDVERVLVATGRIARTGDLGIETLGLEPGEFLRVDDTLRVDGFDWLYAVGDVNHRALLTHQGKYQARAAGDVIAARATGAPVDDAPWGRHVATADAAAVPQVTFTDPEVASVGLTAAAAEKAGHRIRVVDYDLSWLAGATVLADDYRGSSRAVIDADRNVLLGATFVGAGVGELLHAATIAIVGEVPLARLWHAVPSYPTLSEVWLRWLETDGRDSALTGPDLPAHGHGRILSRVAPETAFSAYRGGVITTTDPTTGATRATEIEATTDAGVASIAELAASGAPRLAATTRAWRAGLLDVLADALDADAPHLVETALAETGLPRPRLETEVTRSAFQLRLFADAVREGSYLEAAIDHAAPTPMGPGPDLRRMLVPLGPVAVFGSSNFPFAFSVPGGDTASALAAGCSVVIKAHSSHPLTSQAAFATLSRAADAAGAPAGTLGIVYGTQAGRTLVADPRIAAVGFTGSLGAARALQEIISERPAPIPFYGELSSVNPLVVTPGAATARGAAIGDGLFTSFSGSAGQLCTKPGVAFVPRTATGLIDTLVERVEAAGPQPLLNDRILSSFGEIRDRLVAEGRAEVLATGSGDAAGFGVVPHVLRIDAADLTEAATEEAFGPLVLLAVYDDLDEAIAGLAAVPTSLTATIHSEPGETQERARLVAAAQPRAGRLVFDGYPTGVRVSWAQHHGGPWPATNTQHTSVGVSAMRRFLRPFAWQDAPDDVTPPELRDADRSVPRRVDGRLELPAS